jgi:hypothetical protein
MTLVNDKTPITAVPELDFFVNTPAQESIEYSFIEEVRPIAQLNTGGHIEFVINNAANEYVRLKETTLYVKFKVKLTRTDTTAVSAGDWAKVSVVNNFLNSLWSQVDLCIGDSQTNVALQTYPYRSYFETILGSTEAGRKSYLQAGLFSEDDMAHKDTPNTTRQNYIKNTTGGATVDTGKICELEGKLHLDLMFQHRDLVGGCKLKIKLVPNNPKFYFMTSDTKVIPSINFEDIHLNLTKLKVKENVIAGHNLALDVGLIKYIINRSEVRTVTIDKGATSRNIENVIIGQIPKRVYIAFVAADAYGGAFNKNPYYFDHCNIDVIASFVNGNQYPRKAYTPNFGEDLYIREFTELFRVSGQLDNDARMIITRDNYKTGYTIFAFNLSPDLSQGYNSSGYINVPRDGVLRFEIHFSQALSAIVNALIFTEFDNLISLGPERNAICDYR